MQYTDWGERAACWSGIRSEAVDVHGLKVHYLVTDQTRTPEAPVHLLVLNPANANVATSAGRGWLSSRRSPVCCSALRGAAAQLELGGPPRRGSRAAVRSPRRVRYSHGYRLVWADEFMG